MLTKLRQTLGRPLFSDPDGAAIGIMLVRENVVRDAVAGALIATPAKDASGVVLFSPSMFLVGVAFSYVPDGIFTFHPD